jgi:hypothetical protein
VPAGEDQEGVPAVLHQDAMLAVAHQDAIPAVAYQAAVMEAQYAVFANGSFSTGWFVVGQQPATGSLVIGTERVKTSEVLAIDAIAKCWPWTPFPGCSEAPPSFAGVWPPSAGSHI